MRVTAKACGVTAKARQGAIGEEPFGCAAKGEEDAIRICRQGAKAQGSLEACLDRRDDRETLHEQFPSMTRAAMGRRSSGGDDLLARYSATL